MNPIRILPLALLVACGGADENARSATAPQPAVASATAEVPPAPAAPTDPAAAPATAREPAPDFTLPDLDGRPVSLSSFKGKTVVLEWFNPGCPFVVYAHGEGPLKEMGKKATDAGVVWLAINSGAAGKEGAGVPANREAARNWNIGYPVLIDADGKVGKAYGAKSTPHMYVIDPAGNIAYKGALDDAPRGRAPTAGGVNYVEKALAAVAAGTPVETPETAAYGCSVKYAE